MLFFFKVLLFFVTRSVLFFLLKVSKPTNKFIFFNNLVVFKVRVITMVDLFILIIIFNSRSQLFDLIRTKLVFDNDVKELVWQ